MSRYCPFKGTWITGGLDARLLLLAYTDDAGPGLGVHIARHLIAEVLVVVAVRNIGRMTCKQVGKIDSDPGLYLLTDRRANNLARTHPIG